MGVPSAGRPGVAARRRRVRSRLWVASIAAGILLVGVFSALNASAQLNRTRGRVSIVTPSDGTTVSGSVLVSGTARSSRGARLRGVVVTVDSVRYGTASGTSFWSITLDTSRYSAGRHTLGAVATDSLGRRASTSIAVSISAPPGMPIPTSDVPSPATASPSPTATSSPTSAGTANPTGTAGPTTAASQTTTGSLGQAAASSEFVSRAGTKLTLGGAPFTFTGLNIYSAYKLDLNSALTRIGSGQTVFRAWFFQRMATVNGQRNFAALDNVLAVARAHGMKVIPVLADQWGASTDGPEKYLPWWPAPYGGDGYRTTVWNSTDLVPYRQWVQQVVSRYKDDPTIAYWQLINEGEARNSNGSVNESAARQAIRAFAQDVGGLVKSIDPNHLVSLGTLPGEAGSNEADYAYIHQPAAIDIADYHDYNHPYSAMGDTDSYNGLQTSITRIHALGKVIVVGESGIHWTSLDIPTLDRRAALYARKMSAAFSAGVSGYLLWCWNNPATRTADYEIGPADPALSQIAAH